MHKQIKQNPENNGHFAVPGVCHKNNKGKKSYTSLTVQSTMLLTGALSSSR